MDFSQLNFAEFSCSFQTNTFLKKCITKIIFDYICFILESQLLSVLVNRLPYFLTDLCNYQNMSGKTSSQIYKRWKTRSRIKDWRQPCVGPWKSCPEISPVSDATMPKIVLFKINQLAIDCSKRHQKSNVRGTWEAVS